MAGLLQGVNLPPAIAMPAPSQAYLSDPLGGFTKVLGGFLEGRQTDAAARQKAAIEEATMAGDENALRALTQAGASNQAGLWDPTKLGEVQKAAKTALGSHIMGQLTPDLTKAISTNDIKSYSSILDKFNLNKPYLDPNQEKEFLDTYQQNLQPVQLGSASDAAYRDYQQQHSFGAADRASTIIQKAHGLVGDEFFNLFNVDPMGNIIPIDQVDPNKHLVQRDLLTKLNTEVDAINLPQITPEQGENTLRSGLSKLGIPLDKQDETIAKFRTRAAQVGQLSTEGQAKLATANASITKNTENQKAALEATYKATNAFFAQMDDGTKARLSKLYGTDAVAAVAELEAMFPANRLWTASLEGREQIKKELFTPYFNKTSINGVKTPDIAYRDILSALAMTKETSNLFNDSGINVTDPEVKKQFEDNLLQAYIDNRAGLGLSQGLEKQISNVKEYYEKLADIDASTVAQQFKASTKIYSDEDKYAGKTPDIFTNALTRAAQNAPEASGIQPPTIKGPVSLPNLDDEAVARIDKTLKSNISDAERKNLTKRKDKILSGKVFEISSDTSNPEEALNALRVQLAKSNFTKKEQEAELRSFQALMDRQQNLAKNKSTPVTTGSNNPVYTEAQVALANDRLNEVNDLLKEPSADSQDLLKEKANLEPIVNSMDPIGASINPTSAAVPIQATTPLPIPQRANVASPKARLDTFNNTVQNQSNTTSAPKVTPATDRLSQAFARQLQDKKPVAPKVTPQEESLNIAVSKLEKLTGGFKASPLMKLDPKSDAIEGTDISGAVIDVLNSTEINPAIGLPLAAAVAILGGGRAIPNLAKRMPKILANAGKVAPTGSNVVLASGNVGANKAIVTSMIARAAATDKARMDSLYKEYWRKGWQKDMVELPKTDLQWSDAIANANAYVAERINPREFKSLMKK